MPAVTDCAGNRIPAIENFGAVRDGYDTIDLTDNEIRRLENFPRMTRLKTLLLSNNQLAKVEPEVAEKLLSLETLVLNNNKITEFEDLEGLAGCRKLQYLSLLDNAITKKPHYRLTLISRLPQLRCLDFRKITLAEREAAAGRAPPAAEAADGAARKGRAGARSQAAAEAPAAKRQKTLSDKEIAKIKQQIAAADSFEEIARLEKILETGYSL